MKNAKKINKVLKILSAFRLNEANIEVKSLIFRKQTVMGYEARKDIAWRKFLIQFNVALLTYY